MTGGGDDRDDNGSSGGDLDEDGGDWEAEQPKMEKEFCLAFPPVDEVPR